MVKVLVAKPWQKKLYTTRKRVNNWVPITLVFHISYLKKKGDHTFINKFCELLIFDNYANRVKKFLSNEFLEECVELHHYSIWVWRPTFGHRLCISMNFLLCDWVC